MIFNGGLLPQIHSPMAGVTICININPIASIIYVMADSQQETEKRQISSKTGMFPSVQAHSTDMVSHAFRYRRAAHVGKLVPAGVPVSGGKGQSKWRGDSIRNRTSLSSAYRVRVIIREQQLRIFSATAPLVQITVRGSTLAITKLPTSAGA